MIRVDVWMVHCFVSSETGDSGQSITFYRYLILPEKPYKLCDNGETTRFQSINKRSGIVLRKIYLLYIPL